MWLWNVARLSMWVLPDPSHRVSNDARNAIAGAGLWHCVAMFRWICNVNYGPFEGCAFWRQQQEAAVKYVKSLKHGSCPLLAKLLPLIAQDRDELHLEHTPGYKGKIIDVLERGEAWAFKGPKMAMSRWFSFYDCFKYWDKHWHSRLAVLIYMGLKQGWLVQAHKKLQE